MDTTHSPRTSADERAATPAQPPVAEQPRRTRRTRRTALTAAVVVAVAVAALVTWSPLSRSGTEVEGISRLPAEVDVPTVSDDHGGISFGASGGAGSTSGDQAVRVDLYVDFLCPGCAAFEDVNGSDLDALRADGTATVVLHTISFLDGRSDGSSYSTRAAAAFAYVSEAAPDAAYTFQAALFDHQPREGSAAPTDQQIESIAVASGVPAAVADRIGEQRYREFVGALTQVAFGDPGLLDAQGRFSTPTVLVDGTVFAGDWSRPGALRAAVEAAADS